MYKDGHRVMVWVARIEEVRSIPGADAICAYRVGGWYVVDHTNKYNVGDLAVYCSIDSWIPHELAPFLSKGKDPREYEGVKGERLRTVRLRGQLSQGLLLPLAYCFPNQQLEQFAEDQDLTDVLGIIKWERLIPAQLRGQVKGNWPAGIPKTDEERIQNLVKYWPQLHSLTYEVTEKIDGSSMTVGFSNDEFIVCSRNINLKETDSNQYWITARDQDIESRLRSLEMTHLVLQGELIGPGIQANRYKLTEYQYLIFSVFDQTTGQYLDPDARRAIVSQLKLTHVPVIYNKFMPDMSIDQVLLLADGNSALHKDSLREGVVFKQIDGSIHWKAISNNFLLKIKD